MMKLVKYVDVTQTVSKGGDFPIRENCNSWKVKNVGLDIATVNEHTVLPPVAPNLSGETFGMAGNYGEVYGKRTISISFKTANGPALEITQKIYDLNE